MKPNKLLLLLLLASSSSHAMWTEDANGNVIKPPAKNSKAIKQYYIEISIVEPKHKEVAVVPVLKPGELAIDHKGKKIIGQSSKDVECLAYSIFREAGTLSENAQLAVGQVHINRLKEGSWGDRMCEVVHSKAQFSWTMEKYVKWSDSQKAKFIKEAKDLMNGERVKKLDSEDILHYHATYVQPKWAKQGQLVAQAGAHLFYKNVPY